MNQTALGRIFLTPGSTGQLTHTKFWEQLLERTRVVQQPEKAAKVTKA